MMGPSERRAGATRAHGSGMGRAIVLGHCRFAARFLTRSWQQV